jgi:hypothetical protein
LTAITARPAWGHVAAALLRKPAGLSLTPRHSDRLICVSNIFRSCCVGPPMKNKNRRQRKRRRSARRDARSASSKRLKCARKNYLERAQSPWLRIVPSAVEDELSTDAGRGLFPPGNGRRQPRDLDFYIPENNSPSR